jgi:hypothetical protein
MSIEQPNLPGVEVESPLTLKQMTEVLIKHYELHEGLYEILVEFQIGMLSIGQASSEPIPAAAVGVSRMGLLRKTVEGPSTVDASKVNPEKRSSKKG